MSTEAMLLVPQADGTIKTMHVRQHGHDSKAFIQRLLECYPTKQDVDAMFENGNDMQSLGNYWNDQPYITVNSLTEIESYAANHWYMFLHNQWRVMHDLD